MINYAIYNAYTDTIRLHVTNVCLVAFRGENNFILEIDGAAKAYNPLLEKEMKQWKKKPYSKLELAARISRVISRNKKNLKPLFKSDLEAKVSRVRK